MTPFKQLLVDDCVRTAIGCLLDMPPFTVPHFFEGITSETSADDVKEVWHRIDRWLAEHGLAHISFGFPGFETMADLMAAMKHTNPNRYYLLFGSSPVGDHVVVCLNDEMICDPSWTNNGLIGPSSAGVWTVVTLISSRMLAAA